MYVQEFLAKERQHERLKQAREERVGQQVAELKKVERRRHRAERDLVRAWRRVDQLRSMIEVAS